MIQIIVNNPRHFNSACLLIKNEKIEKNKKINPNVFLDNKINKDIKRKAIDRVTHCFGYFTLYMTKKNPAKITKSNPKKILIVKIQIDSGKETIDSIIQNFGVICLFINKEKKAKNKK